MITQALVKELFEYKDGELFWKEGGRPKVRQGDRAGFVTTRGYRKVSINSKRYYIHRLVFLMFHGYFPKFVDHINGNSGDNRIENLREATNAQNMHNAKLSKTNTSGVKGVSWHKDAKKWRVRLSLNGKRINLGLYNTLEQAATVSKTARQNYHKEFTNHG